ncbi:MAG: hypothetical protein NVS3B3_10390 [Aquirhabdus sp.]
MNDTLNAQEVVAKISIRNKAFTKEYEIVKKNQSHFTNLVVMPDRFPLICELFGAIKTHLLSMTATEIENGDFKVRFPYFGHTWTIGFLHTGINRRNEVYLTIGYPEPIRVPMATVAFEIPEHWEF